MSKSDGEDRVDTLSEEKVKDETQGARATANAHPILKQGYLGKLGGQVKRWKRRYFVVQGGFLRYLKSPDGPELGLISLGDAVMHKYGDSVYAKPACFGVQPAGRARTFVIQATSLEEREVWLQLLSAESLVWKPARKGCAPSKRQAVATEPAVAIQEVQTLDKGDYSDSDSEKEESESDLSIDSASSEDEGSGRGRCISRTTRGATSPLGSRRSIFPPVEGFLLKQGHKQKNWKRRFFRLDGHMLYYFPTHECTTCLGEVHMIGVTTKHEPIARFKEAYAFSMIETQGRLREYYCIANSKEDLQRWLSALVPRHRYINAPMPLQLSLKEHRHIGMTMSPDVQALQAIAVDSQHRESHGMSPSHVSTKSKNSAGLKGVVSMKKRRFIMDGFDLDLTYVTDRLIAMGFPSVGTEAMYRNSMEDTVRFFDTRHDGHYKIYNLCSERWYPVDNFRGEVVWFPFNDHTPPSFADMSWFCMEVAEWLSKHPKNIAGIHCKAGKGRTGLMITVLLIYCGEWETADEALRYYAFARTKDLKGVTIPSQIRWVHYYEKYMKLTADGLSLKPAQRLVLTKFKLSKKAPSWTFFTASCHGFSISSKESKSNIKKTATKTGYTVTVGEPWVFCTDFCIVFHKSKTLGKTSRVFSFWLHTQFGGKTVILGKKDLDKVSKLKSQADFTIELQFAPAEDQNIRNYPPYLAL